MNTELHWSTGEDAQSTPQGLWDDLHARYRFVWDAAAVAENSKCGGDYFGPDHPEEAYRDALAVDWRAVVHPGAVVWLNPPYSKPELECRPECKKKTCAKRGHHLAAYKPGCGDFVAKAAEERLKGISTVLLLAARTDNDWFHRYIWDAKRGRWRLGVVPVDGGFLSGRLKFNGADTGAPFPSLLVLFEGV